MKTTLRRILLGSCLALAAALSAHAQKTVKLVTLDWEPYIGASLPQQGFVAQIVKAAYQTQGYEVVIEFQPWARAVAAAKDGIYDGLFPEYFDETRLADFVYSAPFPGGPVGFVKRKDNPITFTTLEALKPYSIGVVRGYVNEAKFDQATFLKKQEADDDAMNLRKLAAKRLDLAVIDKYVAQYLLAHELSALADALEFVEPPLEAKSLYIAFSKKAADQDEKRAAFDRGLAEIERNGTLQAIVRAALP
ncbi:MAG TPA: transporter substrate-binding domain-containing protein [Opitutaceae bacterium]|nr:transporter substrate-binding domain-containing protein [Opitutaceae bacterium]